MATNEEVVEAFIAGKEGESRNVTSIWWRKRLELRSYARTIAWWQDGEIHVDESGASTTTSKHRALLHRLAPAHLIIPVKPSVVKPDKAKDGEAPETPPPSLPRTEPPKSAGRMASDSVKLASFAETFGGEKKEPSDEEVL